jgi:hypothetical protein
VVVSLRMMELAKEAIGECEGLKGEWSELCFLCKINLII